MEMASSEGSCSAALAIQKKAPDRNVALGLLHLLVQVSSRHLRIQLERDDRTGRQALI